MANQEHLDILRQGVEVWNEWRSKGKKRLETRSDIDRAHLAEPNQRYRLIEFDLEGADLSKSDLSGADLSRSDLSNAHLRGARLVEVNLSEACLRDTDFVEANLSRANLNKALLDTAILTRANLGQATLIGAKFIRANLLEATLIEANLSQADLRGSNFFNAVLTGADLTEVDLSRDDLSRTDLRRATLHKATLFQSFLNVTNLSGAELREANFTQTILRWPIPDGADFGRAIVGSTIFSRVDLRAVKGLDTMKHAGPSTIGLDTIIQSQGKIPTIFLRNVGVPDSIIEAIPTLISSLRSINFSSCFNSYSDKDRAFAEQLYADLQSKGVRCWFAPEDLKIGDHYHQRIDESIHLYDKLILILSERAVQSAWVEREVVAAREKEDREQRPVLFPIRLDEAVMSTSKAWAADIRRRWHIGDFSQWKQRDHYQKALERLLRDLRSESQQ